MPVIFIILFPPNVDTFLDPILKLVIFLVLVFKITPVYFNSILLVIFESSTKASISKTYEVTKPFVFLVIVFVFNCMVLVSRS